MDLFSSSCRANVELQTSFHDLYLYDLLDYIYIVDMILWGHYVHVICSYMLIETLANIASTVDYITFNQNNVVLQYSSK